MNRKSFLKSLVAAVVMSPIACRLAEKIELKASPRINSSEEVEQLYGDAIHQMAMEMKEIKDRIAVDFWMKLNREA